MSNTLSQTSLFVFVKKPTPGGVKTRLGAEIGLENAAKLYQSMAETCLTRYQKLSNINCTVYYDPPEEGQFFRDWFGQSVSYFPQSGEGLGERLNHGFNQMLERSPAAIALGSDSPDLPLQHLQNAIDKLRNHDVVIGPASDGGYYCIGLKRPVPELFDEIDWSTPHVFKQTFQRCKSLDLSVFQAPEWSDIDYKDDLIRLKQSADPDVLALVRQFEPFF